MIRSVTQHAYMPSKPISFHTSEVHRHHWSSCMLLTHAWKRRTCRHWRSPSRCPWVCCLLMLWWGLSLLAEWSRFTNWAVKGFPRATCLGARKTWRLSKYRYVLPSVRPVPCSCWLCWHHCCLSSSKGGRKVQCSLLFVTFPVPPLSFCHRECLEACPR